MSDTTNSDTRDGDGDGIEPIEIQQEMEASFLEYAMSVIVSRALPDVRDGLKPVHRRILWSMYDSGTRPDRGHVKCATVVGDVIGKYHPHGDTAIYDSMVRMGQSFSLRHTLIDPHGNFGSPSDPPAAYRYTECRLEDLAMRLLDGIDNETVDFVSNFDGRFDEPTVLPSRFPNLLVNGSQGIAVGMATNIPPHNMGEVIDATLHLLENPEADVEALMEFVKGPDFPTKGLILGRAGIRDAYTTGRGSVKMRARAEIEETKTGGEQIVVTEIPYQTSTDGIITKAAEAVNAGTIEGIRAITDESAKGKTRIVFSLKRDQPALIILNKLYKHTPLQTSFGVNMVALVDGVPRTLTLRDALVHYIAHQVEVVTRRTEYLLGKAKDRLHIVEGLLKALDMIDAIIALIRGSENRGAASEGLQSAPFEFSERQAVTILDMQLGRLTRLGKADLLEEQADLLEKVTGYEAILADPVILRGVIRDEMTEIRDKYANDRISELTFDPGDFDIEDLIDDEDIIFTMSHTGYVKTVSVDEFKTQGRGGRGVSGGNLKDEDTVFTMVQTSAHAYLMFFSSRGKVYRLKAHQVPMTSRTARGTALVNLLPLEQDERIMAVVDTRDYETNRYLFFATRKGRVKKTLFNAYDSSLKAGLIAIKLNDDDELVEVRPVNDGEDVFLVSRNGQTMRFDEADVRPMGRTAAGVRGMKFRDGDELVSLSIEREDAKLLTITSNGFGKRSDLDQFPKKGRGGLGVRGMKITEGKGVVVASFMVGDDDQVFLTGTKGTIIRMSVGDISVQGRSASGVSVMNVQDGSEVAAVAPAFATDEDEDDAAQDAAADDAAEDGASEPTATSNDAAGEEE